DVSRGVRVVRGPVLGREPPDELGVRGAAARSGEVGPAGRPRLVLGAAEAVGAHRVDKDERGDSLRVVRRVPHRHRPAGRPADEVEGTPVHAERFHERAQVVREVGHAPGGVERPRLGAAETPEVGGEPVVARQRGQRLLEEAPARGVAVDEEDRLAAPGPGLQEVGAEPRGVDDPRRYPFQQTFVGHGASLGCLGNRTDPAGRHSTRLSPRVPRRTGACAPAGFGRFRGIPRGMRV
ncbi:MAG: hypothetical protein AVDCRST_MAG05-5086, partial [uncultured Rubrobacteraceae bacterium]